LEKTRLAGFVVGLAEAVATEAMGLGLIELGLVGGEAKTARTHYSLERKEMRVLSLFDGISCARVALDRAGLPVTEYLASEIDPKAIAISAKNYPDIVRLGDVREVCMSHLKGPIDLLVGGSPCVDLSIAKQNRKGLDGDQSSLFWEYVRIWELLRPKWFILENVASMPKADRDIITKTLGVDPVMIDASLVSAQTRKRLFWTNIPGVTQPEDRGIRLKDILQPDGEVDESMTVNGKSFCLTATYHKAGTSEAEVQHNRERGQRTMVFTATAQTGRNPTKKLGYVGEHDHQAKRVYDDEGKLPALNVVCNSLVKVGHIGNTDGQANRVYSPEGKSVTLSANGGGSGAKTGLYAVGQAHIRKLTPVECERLQGLPDGYTEGVAKTHRYKALGNAFNVDVVAHLLRGVVLG
jgi:DNA (cytosine-5)-methyltransferase 3A